MPSVRPAARPAVLLAGLFAFGATSAASAQATQLQANIVGYTVESQQEIGGPEAIEFFLTGGGQELAPGTVYSTSATGSASSLARYGTHEVFADIRFELTIEIPGWDDPIGPLVVFNSARNQYRAPLTFTWDEGFDPTEPIPVTVRRRVVVPTGGDVVTLGRPFIEVDGQHRAFVQSGLIEGDAFNTLDYFANETNYGQVPQDDAVSVTIAPGGVIELQSRLEVAAYARVDYTPEFPDFTVLETECAIVAFGGMWVEVPEGVIVSAENGDVDVWTTPYLPPADCPADLSGDGTVGFDDILAVLANFGPGPGGDADQDGDTDFTDLLMVLAEFGSTCA